MAKAQNNDKTSKQRGATSGGFKSGKSGNPGGRPKLPPEVKFIAQSYAIEALATLAVLMRSENENVAVRAAEALLDRGYGRPAQAVEVSGKDGEAIKHDLTVTLNPDEAYMRMVRGK